MLPLFSNENDWPTPLRAVLYCLGMVYCFVGVSIIADIFMDSITVVTQRRRKVRLDDDRTHTRKVWNDTVATLSLMALGSSAPEICLSMIELTKREMHVGGLGPSTIVGSAAFNLLVIVAVCMMSIPSTEGRRIHALPVFYVTAAFSVLAYLWLVFILTVSSVDVVDIWEAVVTLLMLPALIWISWKTDTGDLQKMFHRLMGKPEGSPELPSIADKVILTFKATNLAAKRGTEEYAFEVLVDRTGDCSGKVSCGFRTERFTAVPEYDYTGEEGELVFECGVTQQAIMVQLLPNAGAKGPRELFLILHDPVGAEFNPADDGGEDSAICSLVIEHPTDDAKVEGLFNRDSLHLGMKDWARQSWACLYVNGSAEDQRNASFAEWMSHMVCLPWKVLFVFVPPVSLLGGWCCFYSSLCMIAALTAALSDLAELFGCVLNVEDIITAITFVALGTSMPDLFASLSAARVDPTADASIVNVTGSNGVNVFLGLGLPWSMGAIYWAVAGRNPDWENRYSAVASRISGAAFVVDSANLGFSVLAFSGACCEALLILFLRRHYLGVELGGPFVPKVFCTFTFLMMWMGYVAAVSWRVMRWETMGESEQVLVLSGIAILEVSLGVISAILIIYYGRRQARPSLRGKSVVSRPQLATHRSFVEKGRNSSRTSFNSSGTENSPGGPYPYPDESKRTPPDEIKDAVKPDFPSCIPEVEEPPYIEAERCPEVINARYLTGASAVVALG